MFMRCLLQYFVFDITGLPDREHARKIVVDDLEETILPADVLIDPANMEVEAPHDDRFQIARRMETFVNRVRDVRTAIAPSIHTLNRSAAVLRLPKSSAHEPIPHQENALSSRG